MNVITTDKTTFIQTPKGRIIQLYPDVFERIKSQEGLVAYLKEHGKELYHEGTHIIAFYEHETEREFTYDLCLDCESDYRTPFFRSRLFGEDNETTICLTLENGLEDMIHYVDEMEQYKK